MNEEALKDIIARGEGGTVELKRCGGKPGADVFETVCSFANRDGGSIYLGVSDDGAVEGVPRGSALAIRRNVVNVTRNQNLFSAAPTVEFEDVEIDGKLVIRVWVPASQGVFRFKGVVYDRVADADVRLRHDSQISALYIRKYSVYTEQHIFPHLRLNDLRADLIERARRLAVLNRPGHPWGEMGDEELLRSAQLWGRDIETGVEGYNRACALIFGRDEVIPAAAPAYRTDAVVRLEDRDRYDDRVVVRTNLIDSYEQLEAFCQKHLPDPFYLEGTQRVSVRDVCVRELVSNTLIHREYTSPYPARIVIDADGFRTENASRAIFEGRIRLGSFSPMPKNPIIAGFFAQIGRAEELGSGMRNLQKYARPFMGADPVLEEGDVFVARIPRGEQGASADLARKIGVPKPKTLRAILARAEALGSITPAEAAAAAGVTTKTAAKYLKAMAEHGILRPQEGKRTRAYGLARLAGGERQQLKGSE